jgi:hypothetical protein
MRATGGVLGAAGTFAVRETLDHDSNGNPRNLAGASSDTLGALTYPSVLYGLGGGALATGLWWMDANRYIDAPAMLDDVLPSFAVTGVPAGAVSALDYATGGLGLGGVASNPRRVVGDGSGETVVAGRAGRNDR